jgi:transcriptional regulator with XRE-family HTH domain
MSLRQLAHLIKVHHGTIGKWETGRLMPTAERLTTIFDALKVEESERERLLAMIPRPGPGEVVAGVPSTGRQLAQLIGYERAATRITEVAPMLLPGILQTREYAWAFLSAGPDTERRVKLRTERAEILTRDELPVELHVIVHEEALTRPVAPPEVMREQLRHLLRMAKRPNITIQVVPANTPGAMPSLLGPFIVLEFADAPPVVHLEHYRAGVFLWEYGDVRSFMVAADEMTQKAMTPARSAMAIAGLAKESR